LWLKKSVFNSVNIMKNRKGMRFILIPVVITLCIYLVFYSRIESKPDDAGFWMILALGMSLGAGLVRFFQWLNAKKTDHL